MKKFIQLLIVFIFTSYTCLYSQEYESFEYENERYPNEIERIKIKSPGIGAFDMGVGIGNILLNKINVNFMYGFHINERLTWGIGTGLHIYNENHELTAPIFVNFLAKFKTTQTTPYFSLNGGYYFFSNIDDHGVLFNPSVGIRFVNRKKFPIKLGLGYDFRFTDNIEWEHPHTWFYYGLICLNFGITY